VAQTALLAHVVSALHTSGVEVASEPRGWKGHADIVINGDHRNTPRHVLHQGRGLVANALLWHTPSEFRESLDRLLPQVTKFDRQATIIVFVCKGGLAQVMQMARLVCEKHPAFGNFGKAVAENQMKLWLSISKNPDKVIATTLLFCDLSERPQAGDIGDPRASDPWEPYGGTF
jgi:hypothetical protein